MTKQTILVDLDRCTGCWSCSLGCKIGNNLDDDIWWQTVRTLGSGEGIDRPAGTWPDLTMSWMPVYTKKCILCASRVAKGNLPYCVASCPTDAISFGDLSDPTSSVSQKKEELQAAGSRLFSLSRWEDTRKEVVYARSK